MGVINIKSILPFNQYVVESLVRGMGFMGDRNAHIWLMYRE